MIDLWSHKKVTLVFLTKDDESTIRNQVEEGFLTGFVDEVLVVDSSSRDRTLAEVSYTKARISSCSNVFESFRRAIDRASGDLIIFGDPKGIVPAKELVKLLAYTDTSSCVFGSRTRWLSNELEGKEKKLFLKNLKLSSKLGASTITGIDDILPPIFLLDGDTKGLDFQFSGHKGLLPFDVMRTCIISRSMFFQVPIEYHSYTLDSDSSTLSDRHALKEIKSFIKEMQRRERPERRRHAAVQSKPEEVDGPDEDPAVIKRRLAYLRKRLGDYDKPYIAQDAREKIEAAVKNAASSRNRSSSSSRRRKSQKPRQAR